MKLYLHVGPLSIVGHPDLPVNLHYITATQIEEARVHLFGAIQQSTRGSNTILRFINKYADDPDGILLWSDISKYYDKEGNQDIYEQKQHNILNQTFHKDYPGGLIKFLDDKCEAYSALNTIGNDYTDHQKVQNLL